jgi:hypothetical protein
MLVFILKLLLSLVSSKTNKHEDLIQGTPFREVREKGEIWLLVDGARTIMTIGNTLYVHPEVWKEHHPTYDYSKSVVQVHEALHAVRQTESGIDFWILKYITDKEFRYKEEQIAYEAEWRWMVERGHRYASTFSIDWAKMVSGPTYGHMVKFDRALEWAILKIKEIQG